MELNVNYQNLIEKRIKNALLKKTQIKIDM
jgi:hypothetical protein